MSYRYMYAVIAMVAGNVRRCIAIDLLPYEADRCESGHSYRKRRYKTLFESGSALHIYIS